MVGLAETEIQLLTVPLTATVTFVAPDEDKVILPFEGLEASAFIRT